MARKPRKSKIKIPDIAIHDYDTGTPELHAQEIIQVYGQERKRRARVLSSPIDYYFSRMDIDRDQHAAGMQFYKLWYHGGGKINYSAMDLTRQPGTHDSEYSSVMRERYRAALQAFQAPIRHRIVFEVVCVGESADSSMRRAIRECTQGAHNYKKRMEYLRNGLDDLVIHFTNSRRNAAQKIPLDKKALHS